MVHRPGPLDEKGHRFQSRASASGGGSLLRLGTASVGTASSYSQRRCSAARLVARITRPDMRPGAPPPGARPRAPARSCRAPTGCASRAGSDARSRPAVHRRVAHAERLGDRRDDQSGIADRSQIDEPRAVRKLAGQRSRHGHAEPGLSRTRGPSKREQPRPLRAASGAPRDLMLSADQGRRLQRKVVAPRVPYHSGVMVLEALGVDGVAGG